jgi:hypothetical protein
MWLYVVFLAHWAGWPTWWHPPFSSQKSPHLGLQAAVRDLSRVSNHPNLPTLEVSCHRALSPYQAGGLVACRSDAICRPGSAGDQGHAGCVSHGYFNPLFFT